MSSLSHDETAPSYRVRDKVRVPALALVLGFLPMLPIIMGAGWVWLWPQADTRVIVWMTTVWSGSILAFLAGVRRGLSFRSPNGETPSQIGTMLYIFALALGSFLMPSRAPAIGLLIVGFASLGVLDTRAASKREAPPYFARLRPVQMMVAVLGLFVLLAKVAWP